MLHLFCCKLDLIPHDLSLSWIVFALIFCYFKRAKRLPIAAMETFCIIEADQSGIPFIFHRAQQGT